MTPTPPPPPCNCARWCAPAANSKSRWHEVPVPEPGADEVLVRIEATPINPSDLGLLFGAADMSTLQVAGTAERPVRHRAHSRASR